MRISLVLISLYSWALSIANAQDTAYVRSIIDSLCAPRYHGRGYVESGDRKAASFILRELSKIGTEVDPIQQEFSMGVNVFEGEMKLFLNAQTMQPGLDFIPNPKSCSVMGAYKTRYFNPKWAENREKMFALASSGKFNDTFVVLPEDEDNAAYQSMIAELARNPLQAKGYIVCSRKKLTWSVGRMVMDCAIFHVCTDSIPKRIKRVEVEMDQRFESNHLAANVIANLPGTNHSDSSVVLFTAHLDHLGRMGAATYIPGANDNASGSAMLLDLYRYYQVKRPAHSTAFIWFAGEEAGLVGSTYFVEQPLIELNRIRFLINLDLMGDAKTGITVVNGKIFNDQYEHLTKLNEELKLLDQVKARGAAANSDHHPFYEKGVPSFFIYTTGDYLHYHDVKDKPQNLPLTKYSEVFRLITAFVGKGI